MKIQHIQYEGIAPFRVYAHHLELDANAPENVHDDHAHDLCEIYVNLTGDVSFMVENRIYPIRSGDMIITRPFEYHHCIFRSNTPHRHFWILFSPHGNERFLEKFFSRNAGEGNHLTVDAAHAARFLELCHALTEEQKSPLLRHLQFLELLALIDGATDADAQAVPDTDILTDVLKKIDQGIAQPISIRDLARDVHMSINTLERHFLRTLHTTPSAYIKQRRLSLAARLLEQGHSVSDAAEQSGFFDYSGFIALFKKHYGKTPLQYKKALEQR